jgi:hypothetical protein
MKQFFKYFKNEWLVQHIGWCEGYLEKVPQQIIYGVESINSTLNKEATCQCCQRMIKRYQKSGNHPQNHLIFFHNSFNGETIYSIVELASFIILDSIELCLTK